MSNNVPQVNTLNLKRHEDEIVEDKKGKKQGVHGYVFNMEH